MGHFTQEFIDFFEELRFNNSKDWFDENRKNYRKYVKGPFEEFITELILKISEFDSEILISPKAAIFRINRDIRFTKDKTPYKTHMAASISRTKRKEEDFAGYYVHVSPFEVYMGGGVYFINSTGLKSIRNFIIDYPEQFERVVYDYEFLQAFGSLKGDRLKRLPKEITVQSFCRMISWMSLWNFVRKHIPSINSCVRPSDTANKFSLKVHCAKIEQRALDFSICELRRG